MTACTGQCCAAFPLPYTREEFLGHLGYIDQGQMIYDMIRPLTPDSAAQRMDAFNHNIGDATNEHLFTCVHWDDRTRLCRVYDQRPKMCRDYPYWGTNEDGTRGEPSACGYCGYRVSDGVSR